MKVAFYKGTHRLFNRVVAWGMRGPYSHCEAIVDEFYDLQSQEMIYKCWSSSFLDGGVRSKWMPLDPANWDVFEIDCNPADVTLWFEQNIGKKYDWVGLLGFIVRRIRAVPGKFFCSGALAAALGLSDYWRFEPNALYSALGWKYTLQPVTLHLQIAA